MRVLVFGRSGQVARELLRRAPAGVEIECLGRAEADLSQDGRGAEALAARDPDVVVNAAAWTAVDAAEAEAAAAHRLNALAPEELARACASRGLPFLHVSTDYVFDGSGEAARAPDAPTAPRSVYGRTKLEGERRVLAAAPESVVLRTSWVFSAHGANFVKTMLRLGAEREELSIVADQVGGPTPAAAIADALLAMAGARAAGEGAAGVHHFSGAPDVSWADFAEAIFARSGLPVRVRRIATADYPTAAERPLNSRLDCSTMRAAFGIERPDWRDGLDAVLAELNA
ncbi:MAG: dTDP-4-dehydrorhamnose reductase [Pseudomonadales bacterium]|jgi:dTDP-4-dehydrorhamnose reductase|nr:dTDP-4-dehydrorhamnose reductase [Pseudomonadales bacterium]